MRCRFSTPSPWPLPAAWRPAWRYRQAHIAILLRTLPPWWHRPPPRPRNIPADASLHRHCRRRRRPGRRSQSLRPRPPPCLRSIQQRPGQAPPLRTVIWTASCWRYWCPCRTKNPGQGGYHRRPVGPSGTHGWSQFDFSPHCFQAGQFRLQTGQFLQVPSTMPSPLCPSPYTPIPPPSDSAGPICCSNTFGHHPSLPFRQRPGLCPSGVL